MSGIDDGAVSASDGDRCEKHHWTMEVAEIVGAGVCSTGIGEPGHIGEGIGRRAAVGRGCSSSGGREGVVLGLHVAIQGISIT